VKFNETVADKIINYLRAGAFVETAAIAAGIHKDTFYEWMKIGRANGHPGLAAWVARVDEAVAMSEVVMIGLVGKAAQEGQWQAAAWHLERKYPQRWGRRDRVEHSGPGGAPIETVDRTPPDAMTSEQQISRLAALIGKAAGG
jgi:hypothetical protein